MARIISSRNTANDEIMGTLYSENAFLFSSETGIVLFIFQNNKHTHAYTFKCICESVPAPQHHAIKTYGERK
jgi:hypothetical protein